MAISTFIFDLAGTTVRDDGFVARAFERAAASIGITPDSEWVRARMGVDKREVFREMLRMAGRDESLSGDLASVFERSIEQELDAAPPAPLPGALEAIDAMNAAGIRVAFTTGFSAQTAQSVMRRMGWEQYPVVASDQVARGRPAPDLIQHAMRAVEATSPASVGVAGDTPSDLLAGEAAGCTLIVGVGHGSHTLEELKQHPHTHLLADLRSLSEIVRGTP